MVLLTIAFGGFILIFFYVIHYVRRSRGTVEKLGIPVDPPGIIFGSPPHVFHKIRDHEYRYNMHKKFGQTYGAYCGSMPLINTINPDIIKSVCLKNADCFEISFNFKAPRDNLKTLDIAYGDTWSSLRKSLSPTFTSGKLKAMMEPMEGISDDTMNFIDTCLKKTNGTNVIDMKKIWKGYALNTIAQCGFGIETDAHNKPDQPLIRNGEAVFAEFRATNWFITAFLHIFNYFPNISDYINLFPPEMDKVRDIAIKVMERREEAGINGTADFLGRIATLIKQVSLNPNDENLRSLNKDVLTAQPIIFFLAGYETTTNNLTTIIYNLTKYPDMQQKLYEDIQNSMEKHGGKLDHDTILDMVYMDAVIQENLRINGPLALHSRVCTKDCEVIPGLFVKKGTRVDMPIYTSHHWPEFFPKPEIFNPERFLKGSDGEEDIIPYTYRPFGSGLRLCIGQRFSLIETKIGLAKLLCKYRLLPSPETKLDFHKGELFLLNCGQMMIKLEERSK